MQCPCKNCLTLPICKTLELHDLAEKCCNIAKYLKVVKINHKIIKQTDTEEIVESHLSSQLGNFTHRMRINRIRKFIPHTYEMD